MHYIVLDLEWNQPKSEKHILKRHIYFRGEIIQIGAVKLDEECRVLDTFNVLIRPVYYKKMHRTVSKLTQIKTEDLQQGITFQAAMKHFRKWCGKDFVFLTWGPDDIRVLYENLEIFAMSTSWLPETYDIQSIFDAQITKEGRQFSLSGAMNILEESPLEAHDALHDAWNTVCVCLHLDIARGMSEYTKSQQLDRYCKNAFTENKTLIKDFSTREEALNAPEVIRFDCPCCGEQGICTGIVKQSMKKAVATGKCENGDEFTVRFRFGRHDDGQLIVNRILYEMNETDRKYYSRQKKVCKKIKCQMNAKYKYSRVR